MGSAFEDSVRKCLSLEGSSCRILRNPSVAVLYELGLQNESGVNITSTGALSTDSGVKKGRSPKDKRLVDYGDETRDIWWGPVNIPISEHIFKINLERAVDYLSIQKLLYVIDGYAGWDLRYRQKIRVICTRAYHALFMRNMLIRPTQEELDNYGEPDLVIYNSGEFPANKNTEKMTSKTSICLDVIKGVMVILGTGYAGEMKKGVFTFMHYKMPRQGVLSLHSSANEGAEDKSVSIFFGLSGTGKTTLSADPKRILIGDDEHCWCDTGIFNIEGGCYAKCVGLKEELEPEIFHAIKFGSVLENVRYDKFTRVIDYDDTSETENTRCAYPIEYISNAKIPCIAGHPKNIILLTCDAFGVLPPVSKLTPEQVTYHFISGYTAKIPGTEEGIQEPTATFSACFGAPFIVYHPTRYAKMLADMMKKHAVHAWLINTGWTGGKYKVGSRIPLKYSRAILDEVNSGNLLKVEYEEYSDFHLMIPKSVKGVPCDLLNPRKAWKDTPESFNSAIKSLGKIFRENFKKYEKEADKEIVNAGPSQ